MNRFLAILLAGIFAAVAVFGLFSMGHTLSDCGSCTVLHSAFLQQITWTVFLPLVAAFLLAFAYVVTVPLEPLLLRISHCHFPGPRRHHANLLRWLSRSELSPNA